MHNVRQQLLDKVFPSDSEWKVLVWGTSKGELLKAPFLFVETLCEQQLRNGPVVAPSLVSASKDRSQIDIVCCTLHNNQQPASYNLQPATYNVTSGCGLCLRQRKA